MSTVLASLVGVYYRNEIMKMITDIRAEQTTPIASAAGKNVSAADLGITKLNYENAFKAYLQNDIEYAQAKREFRANWTPEINAKVEHLVEVDRSLLNKIYDLRYEMTEQGMTNDDIIKINALVRNKVYIKR